MSTGLRWMIITVVDDDDAKNDDDNCDGRWQWQQVMLDNDDSLRWWMMMGDGMVLNMDIGADVWWCSIHAGADDVDGCVWTMIIPGESWLWWTTTGANDVWWGLRMMTVMYDADYDCVCCEWWRTKLTMMMVCEDDDDHADGLWWRTMTYDDNYVSWWINMKVVTDADYDDGLLMHADDEVCWWWWWWCCVLTMYDVDGCWLMMMMMLYY